MQQMLLRILDPKGSLAARKTNKTDTNKNDLCRVNWTKEFMEKVRKSNERAKLNAKTKLNKRGIELQVSEEVTADMSRLQQNDGICTQVEQELEDDHDILDYEDDLSMEGDDCNLVEVEENSMHPEPTPGTSGQEQNKLVEQLAKQPEDELMQNPVIQRMMQTFFKEQFQNLEQQKPVEETVHLNQHPEDRVPRRSDVNALELEEAQKKAEKVLVDAEKFKAMVEQPTGMTFKHNMGGFGQNDLLLEGLNGGVNTGGELPLPMPVQGQKSSAGINIPDIGGGVSDDDFFHLTCHIEPSLIHKIEKGEFVELEKILPKERLGGKTDEGRLEWVHWDGGTFLVPAQRDNKIARFRRWEQAFRAYATIYCGANPHRSKEIWQYITVINTAASSYTWENVYSYDITFRHLMAFNPQRSWAVTYNQMWNLSMKDPIPKNSKGGYVYQHSVGSGYVSGQKGFGNNTHNSNPMQVRRNKSDYCWNFNRGVPCRFGSKCKFIERCKYCDSPTHGVNACHKLQRKEGARGGNSSNVGDAGNANNNNNQNNQNSSNK